MKKLTDGRRTQRAMWAKKGGNYRENQVLQATFVIQREVDIIYEKVW